jgi:GT2 family glycosyltransferase
MVTTRISIIILSFNTKEYLRKCLESLVGSLKSQIFVAEIIVVDNGSTDGSSRVVESYKVRRFKNLKVKLIENKRNLGFAKGNNIGLKEAKGDYIMILNSDTNVQPEAIKILLDRVKPRQERVAVSPLLILPNGRPQIDYYMRFPNLWQVFLYHNRLLRPPVMRMPFLSSHIAQEPLNMPFEVDQLPGATLLASRNTWAKVGLLDESYHFLFEDVDWCWRARKIGVRLVVVPEAVVVHVGGASWHKRLKKDSPGFYYQFFASMLLFVRKNYGNFKGEIFKWAIILNFLLTLKPNLAWKFLKNNGRQFEFLE